MGTYNASAYNDNHTLLKLILNIQDYLHKNPNVALYHTVGFQGTVATTSIPKDKVYGPVGSTNTPTAGDLILYALDLGQGFFQVGGADEVNYTGEYIGQTLTGPKGDPGTPGAAATIAVGTVTTGDPTTPAAVSNVGTENAAVFNFTIPRGEKGDKGDPGTGYSQLTGLYFNRQNDSVTYSDGIAVFVGQFQLTTADGNSTFANGAVTLPIVAGAGIIIEASADGRSLIIKAAHTEYVISGGYGHCENNNPAAVADEGTAYVATITANSGYNFGTGYTLTVTMGGMDITSEVAVITTDTISINIPSVTGDIYINCVAVEIPPQLTAPTIAMNADGKTLEITDVENATSYDVYVDGTLKTNVASVPNTTTVDLSTLSDITDGTHTVTVKAKADGYIDSEASNVVNYTSATPIPTDSILFAGETSDFTLKATYKEWDGTVEYSTDKNTWSTWDGSEISSANKKLYLRGKNNTKFYTSYGARFVLSANAGCYGNINTLLDYENPPIAVGKFCYKSMFYGCTSLTTAPALPATTLEFECYNSMFQGCSSLTTAPELPATTLARFCYLSMFNGCTSLTTAPELPATTLAESCYQSMFNGCTSLTTAPALPAKTLATDCYRSMFQGCSSLTTAPALPATTLRSRCYQSMFQDCTGLKISATQTGEYTTVWRIPSAGEIADEANNWNIDMLKNTGGTFTADPDRNTTYYGVW